MYLKTIGNKLLVNKTDTLIEITKSFLHTLFI